MTASLTALPNENLWRISLLGKFCAVKGSVTLAHFRTQKTALLLAYLALFPHGLHPREELADLLWPEADLESGRNSLKQSLALLRRDLEPSGSVPGSVLVTTRFSVHLNPASIVVDAVRFRDALETAARCADPEIRATLLSNALSLYQGDLLPGLDADWIVQAREDLQAAYETACRERSALPTLFQTTVPHVPVVHSLNLSLPVQWTRFFGREEEQAQLLRFCSDPSVALITVTGPAGVGKTRLAVETARQGAALFAGMIVWVSAADGALRQLPELLTKRQASLLVLDGLEDNAEHITEILGALHMAVPKMTVLVTSRNSLSVKGERELRLPALGLPLESDSPEQLTNEICVQFLADRMQAARSDFQITACNVRQIAALCRALDGLPLAMELAAASAHVLTLAQIRERANSPDVLENTLHWICDLLPCKLQWFWKQLSVFRGGGTVQAAAEVCREPRAREYLTLLRAYGLVSLEEHRGEMRFCLHPALREFGSAQFSNSDWEALTKRHAALVR